MELYLPEDSYYVETTDLAAYMGEQDIDMIHSMLKCNQGLRDGNPRPRPQLRRKRKPNRPELQTKGSVWTDILPELRTTWARKMTRIKNDLLLNSRFLSQNR